MNDQEFYQLPDQGGISDDIHLFNEKHRAWEDDYNATGRMDPRAGFEHARAEPMARRGLN